MAFKHAVCTSGFPYKHKPTKDGDLKKRLIELATRYPRYGYLMRHNLIKAVGILVNKKRT